MRGGVRNSAYAVRKCLAVTYTTKQSSPAPAIVFLGIYSRKMKTHVSPRKQKACIRMFIAALFIETGAHQWVWINKQDRVLASSGKKQAGWHLDRRTNVEQ